jgi:tetratricopeptide (TPR) repeat protein/ferredoxin
LASDGPCESSNLLPILSSDRVAPDSVRVGHVRKSRMSRRRAAVLIGLHVAFLLHLLHWKLAGTTLSPLEPSETVETLATGVINAGAILFGASILATLILGRFFCGWACHLVALQDLCAWLLTKVGLRPRPLRSRTLVFVPLAAALWMFALPVLAQLAAGDGLPQASVGLQTSAIWRTFPGLGVSLLTFFVCGFAMIYLLGAKGFCTYACPYGGIFGLVDQLAPGAIRVTDACVGCGHCTSVCTSNVEVSHEVHVFGQVTNPGCMKCMDCVSTCPEDALYYGFGKPALFTAARSRARQIDLRRLLPQFSWLEEIVLVLTFAVSIPIFGGLYGAVPFLLALALSAITSFAALLLLRLLRSPDVTLQHYTLASEGRLTRAGRVFAAASSVWLLFTLHSGWVRTHVRLAEFHMARTESVQAAAWAQNGAVLSSLPEPVQAAALAAADQLGRAEALGLFADPSLSRDRALLALIAGDLPAAEAHLRTMIAISPRQADTHFRLAEVLMLRRKHDEALVSYRRAVERSPHQLAYQERLFRAERASGDWKSGLRTLEAILHQRPDHPTARAELGALLLITGSIPRGIVELTRAVEEQPENALARYNLGAALARSRRDLKLAARHLEAAWQLAPEHPSMSAALIADVLIRSGQAERAEALARQALASRPDDRKLLHVRARALLEMGNEAEGRPLLERAERGPASEQPAP